MNTAGGARARLGDAALAIALTLFAMAGTAAVGRAPRDETVLDTRGFALIAVAGLALAARRRRPPATLAVVAACTSVYLVLGYAYGPILLFLMIAVFGAARYASLVEALPCALAGLALLLIHLVVPGTALGVRGAIPVAAWVVVPFSLGFTLRLRKETAVRARAEAIRQSVDDERLRVAQEVHDIVGHGLAAIKMQADVALHVLPRNPAQAEIALEAISRSSSEALDELRATLALVRRSEGEPERSPVPSLARLDGLRQRMADAGVQVRLDTAGEPAPALPAAVDLTGYRIVQESLTNVLRHSGAGQASIGIRYEDESVLITVSNPVTGTPSEGGGSGIPGMRERVRALGGEFSAGPAAHDRFEVHARLPAGGPR
ncbi:sensor histidine kinase [Spirillospora sp. CA-294931]|uniref:sensor histidine kinase n=1 Tax=Spirillospora sp. CA-294931 TaxID=3240042 RepID=UPI003D914437